MEKNKYEIEVRTEINIRKRLPSYDRVDILSYRSDEIVEVSEPLLVKSFAIALLGACVHHSTKMIEPFVVKSDEPEPKTE